MSYVRERRVSLDGRYAYEMRYHTARCMATLPRNRERRAPKEKPTSEQQKKRNMRRRARELAWLCVDNFRFGDAYLTLTYKELPESPEAAKEDFERWKRKARRVYKRCGVPMKYVSVMERLGGGGRPHAHILLPKLPDKAMQEVLACWTLGHVKLATYQGAFSDAKKLMDYFVKEGVEKDTGSGRVATSRNLVRRKPVKQVISRSDTYRDELVPPKGYAVLREFSLEPMVTEQGFPLSVGVFERKPGMDGVYAWRGA